eukprot:scaffold9870_cov36-Cyclotella_meneghiniana.AAC.2
MIAPPKRRANLSEESRQAGVEAYGMIASHWVSLSVRRLCDARGRQCVDRLASDSRQAGRQLILHDWQLAQKRAPK